MKTTYRDFEIEYDTLVGQFMYSSQKLREKGMCNTPEEAKKKIDKYYLDNTSYDVVHSNVLVPVNFTARDKAKDFCRYWGLDIGCILPKIEGHLFNYDAV